MRDVRSEPQRRDWVQLITVRLVTLLCEGGFSFALRVYADEQTIEIHELLVSMNRDYIPPR